MIMMDSGEPLPTNHYSEVLIASNRGPVTLGRDAQGGYTFQRGSGGLVTALTGLARTTRVTWVACALSPEDAAWGQGKVCFEDENCNLYTRFINPDPQAYDAYYNQISNPLLWFLQHSMWDVPRAPVIDRATWDAWEMGYKVVNRQFAGEIADQVRTMSKPVLVMLQDYHLYLTPRYLKKYLRRRDAILSLFVHIPMPGPDYWGILPPGMRQEILDGLCAVDLLGFQTREDGLNFIRTCENYLPKALVRYRRGRVRYRSHDTYVRDFPISIDVDALKALADAPETLSYQQEVAEHMNQRKLILRVDRLEPSKNLLRGFQAYEALLETHPEHCDQVMFLALLTPSRLGVDEYQTYLDEIMAAVGRINARYGDSEWEPVRLLVGENYARAVAALTMYNVLLVNSIADGMNLVAKEGAVVNKMDGVLVLSERTGARQQLEPGALVIAPCDVYATAEAMHQALVMAPEERRERAALLRRLVEAEDINFWLESQLDAIAEIARMRKA
ncbi:MAG: trehalose-6-phosphate synthase [Anaerolineae bacterium]|jgi:trehalose 6-phosphate synthase|nr:trehalose-6-phosphate synthase [Anaerolineae bacterium]